MEAGRQVWGPLVFESRRFVELRQKSFWQQVKSAESTGMGLFYTLNIFCIQARHPQILVFIPSASCAQLHLSFNLCSGGLMNVPCEVPLKRSGVHVLLQRCSIWLLDEVSL